MLPVNLLFDPAGLLAWQTRYFSDSTKIAERSLKWQKLMTDVFPRFQQYQVPVIMLRKPTPKEAVCQVFENVNTGGRLSDRLRASYRHICGGRFQAEG